MGIVDWTIDDSRAAITFDVLKTSSRVSTVAHTGLTPALTLTSQSNPSKTSIRYKLIAHRSRKRQKRKGWPNVLQHGVGMRMPSPTSKRLYSKASRAKATPGAVVMCWASTAISGRKYPLKKVAKASRRSLSPARPFGYDICYKLLRKSRLTS